jgi:hypothetical protein
MELLFLPAGAKRRHILYYSTSYFQSYNKCTISMAHVPQAIKCLQFPNMGMAQCIWCVETFRLFNIYGIWEDTSEVHTAEITLADIPTGGRPSRGVLQWLIKYSGRLVRGLGKSLPMSTQKILPITASRNV